MFTLICSLICLIQHHEKGARYFIKITPDPPQTPTQYLNPTP